MELFYIADVFRSAAKLDHYWLYWLDEVGIICCSWFCEACFNSSYWLLR